MSSTSNATWCGIATDALLETYGAERLPHAVGVVEHAVGIDRLIDELSGRAPQQTGLDAAFGGSCPFPILRHGMIHGEHPAVGRQLPQPTVDGRPLDELLGPDFALVVDDGMRFDGLDPRWDALAHVVEVPAAVCRSSSRRAER